MYFLFCLQVPECFNVVKKFKKVEMDRDILLQHSDNIGNLKKK